MLEKLSLVTVVLLFIKVVLHLVLSGQLEQNIDLRLPYGNASFFFLLLPIMDDVPKKYKTLKIIANVLYYMMLVSVVIILLVKYV